MAKSKVVDEWMESAVAVIIISKMWMVLVWKITGY